MHMQVGSGGSECIDKQVLRASMGDLEQEALVEVAARQEGVLLQGCQVLRQLGAHSHQLPQLLRCLF